MVLRSEKPSTHLSSRSELEARPLYVPRLDTHQYLDDFPNTENYEYIFSNSAKIPTSISSSRLKYPGTQCELTPSSDGAERRVDGPHGSHAPRIIIRYHSIRRTVPGGNPEALEHHLAAKIAFAFFCSRPRYPPIYAEHITDFSEL